MRTLTCTAALLAAATVLLTGCPDRDKSSCSYWVPKVGDVHYGEEAIDRVAELSCEKALPKLEKLFDEGQYRKKILRSVKRIGAEEPGAPIVKKGLKSKGTSRVAASIVEDWELEAAEPELMEILTGSALPKQRGPALQALRSFKDPKDVEELLIELAGNDPNVQGISVNRLAVRALGEAESDEALPVLVKAAFMQDNSGKKVYRMARRALAKLGPKRVPLLLKTARGNNERLMTYAKEQGIPDWQILSGPEIVQLLTDALDPRGAEVIVDKMAQELAKPMGASPQAKEKWRMDQMNRLKVSMLGLGHVGPTRPAVLEKLKSIATDRLADAVNQRLQSMTTLAMIGTEEAQKKLLSIFEEVDNPDFKQPALQPIALGMGHERLEAFEEMTSNPSDRVKEGLNHEKVKGYLSTLRDCEANTACYVDKLDHESKHVVVKSAVMLARGLGDSEEVRKELVKQFAETDSDATDRRRFMLIALTRLGTEKTGEELLDVAGNLGDDKAYWADELHCYGSALKTLSDIPGPGSKAAKKAGGLKPGEDDGDEGDEGSDEE